MDPEGGRAPEPAREVRVEGIGLLLLAGALVVVIGVVFYLGFQLGRGSTGSPQVAAAGNGDELVETGAPATTPPASVFDKGPATGAAEPARQAVPPPTPANSGPTAATPKSAPSAGDWFVQVFAGRDRRAAESVVTSLTAQGYPVQLDSKREGRESLYKVRVGGYADESGARSAADRLRKNGQSGAWVTRAR